MYLSVTVLLEAGFGALVTLLLLSHAPLFFDYRCFVTICELQRGFVTLSVNTAYRLCLYCCLLFAVRVRALFLFYLCLSCVTVFYPLLKEVRDCLCIRT